MDIKRIRALVELVKTSGIAELELVEGEEKLKISAGKTNSPDQQLNHMTTAAQPHPHITTIQSSNNQENALDNKANEILTKPEDSIKSPMVGTFYRASSPTGTPFVEVGQAIKAGQVLCIIEAMKLMNQIEADKGGVIKEIVVKDGDPVEYGQPLFIIIE